MSQPSYSGNVTRSKVESKSAKKRNESTKNISERACDNCHEKKLRCARIDESCERCVRLEIICRFTKPILKRGRRRKIFSDQIRHTYFNEILTNCFQQLATETSTPLVSISSSCEPVPSEPVTVLLRATPSRLDRFEEHLICLYFEFVFPFYPLVKRDIFLQQCHSTFSSLEWELLLNTLCCIACPFLLVIPFDMGSCPRLATNHYHQRALDLLKTVPTIPNLNLLQALIGLLTIEQTNKSQYMKMAFQMARDLKLSEALPDTEEALIWSACFMLDSHWGLIQNTPLFFQAFSTPILDCKALFTSNLVQETLHTKDFTNIELLNCPKSAGYQRYVLHITGNLAGIFHHFYNQLAPIMILISQLAQKLASTNYDLSTQSQFEHTTNKMELISTQLETWLQAAIQNLEAISLSNSALACTKECSVLSDLLTIYYHTLILHLHLPFALFPTQLPHQPRIICLKSAYLITDLGLGLGTNFTLYGHHFRNHARLMAYLVLELFEPTAASVKDKLIQFAQARFQFKFGLSLSDNELSLQYKKYIATILKNYGANHINLDAPNLSLL